MVAVKVGKTTFQKRPKVGPKQSLFEKLILSLSYFL